MTIREASARFLEQCQPKNSQSKKALAQTIRYLTGYLPDAALAELTSARLRDFIARWYVEETNHQPAPPALLDSLGVFLRWVDTHTPAQVEDGCRRVIEELEETLPRALEIARVLSSQLKARGAFGFPEFLTSFEEGGRSQYDVDIGGEVSALEGFFRVSRIEETMVEAEDLISGERVWPVIFPKESVAVIENGYILNLELIRGADSWHIASCGFAYPPGTEF
ncbi:MAG: hypothetical protein WAU45_11140 [Blastocatellia bacterium]